MPRLVVNLVTETGGVDNGQGDAGAFLVQFELCCGRSASGVCSYGHAESSRLTDSDGFDADTLLEVGIGSIIGILALQNLLAAERVDEGCASCSTSKWIVSLGTIEREMDFESVPVPLAPHTIKQNWIPFLTFFLRRILI